jgi:hypothetical protein
MDINIGGSLGINWKETIAAHPSTAVLKRYEGSPALHPKPECFKNSEPLAIALNFISNTATRENYRSSLVCVLTNSAVELGTVLGPANIEIRVPQATSPFIAFRFRGKRLARFR